MALLFRFTGRERARPLPDGTTPPRERAAVNMTLRSQEERAAVMEARVRARPPARTRPQARSGQ